MKGKRAGIPLTANAVVIVIIFLVLILLLMSFMKGGFGKTQIKLEELLAGVPEPSKPSADEPITASSEHIKTKPGTVEVIKFAVFNPTGRDWIFRDALSNGRCGDDTDLICFVDTDEIGTCNDYKNAKLNDLDCRNIDFEGRLCCVGEECGDDGICLINNWDCIEGADPDCAPQEGVQLYLACDDKLTEKNFQYNTKVIKVSEYEVFNALIEVKKNAPRGSYLCQINALGGDDKYTKEVVFEID